MANNLVPRIDMVYINDDGTIEIIDTLSFAEYPFTFQYKLYLTFEENLTNIFKLFFKIPPTHYELSSHFSSYIENRKALFEEVSKEYLPIISKINESQMSNLRKKCIINQIDLALNELYPYKPKEE